MDSELWKTWVNPTTISSIASIITFAVLFIELSRNTNIKKAEFIRAVNADIEKFGEFRTKLRSKNTWLPEELEAIRTDLRDYMIIFEGLTFLVRKGIISKEEFRVYFGRRFCELSDNQATVHSFIHHVEFHDMKPAREYLEKEVCLTRS